MISATCMHTPPTAAVAGPHSVAAGPSSTADPCVATAGIVGGSGYTGALLAELLLRHPSVMLTHVSSEEPRRRAGEQASAARARRPHLLP